MTGQTQPHSGINVQAEATRIVRKFGIDTNRYMADWLATLQPEDAMFPVLRAVQAEAMRQVALI